MPSLIRTPLGPLALLGALLAVAACRHSSPAAHPLQNMTEEFKSPFDVRPGYKDETPFSPVVEDGAQGIRIAIPPEVTFARGASPDSEEGFTYIPVSMTFLFPVSYASRFDAIAAHMVAVAVDAKTGAAFSAPIQEPDFVPSPPAPPDPDPEPGAVRVETLSLSYLTFNLAQVVPLPVAEATYRVHVTLEKHQSNVVTTELRKQ